MGQSPLATLYPDVRWPELFGKIGELQRQEYDWSEAARAITAPTMLVFADADAVSTTHIAEFFGLLGGGLRDAGLDGSARAPARLAVLPGRTHYDIGASPELGLVVERFLADPVPRRL
jgi:pimeloyl-ACP methyl ester carboxylesterase